MSHNASLSTTPLLNIQNPQQPQIPPYLLNPNSDENASKESETTHNKLGTINGCYVPCLLNILGLVLFERLGWGIGQVGILYVLLIYLFAEIAAILTVLSLSAIVTNGNMKGGGSYYMISRTLGPEFGGSVGILFYSAYCVNIAFCCSGCSEEIIKTWFNNNNTYFISYWATNLLFASAILFICLCVSLLGAKVFSKINIFLFIAVFTAISLSVLAGFTRNQFTLPDFKTESYIHQNWNWSQLKNNFINNCPNCYSIQMVFGVLFSGVTGIMEGANLSGDLANPSKSIPFGTLSAICTAIIVYLLLIISFGGSFSENVLREVTTIPQNVSWSEFGYYLSIFGVLISSSSSALGSLFGGSRVLQAVARDKIFPSVFNKLSYGTKNGDEPLIAVIITWFISQCLLFIGGINVIAPFATSFFCLSWSAVNLSCFLLCISGITNFRPQFKYYNKWTALIGLIMNILIMFFVDFIFASISLFAEICIFIYLIYRNNYSTTIKKNDWGDVGQSVIFHQIRKYLLELNKKQNIYKHSKLWRPHILLLVDNHQLSLIDFCNNLKKGGLYIIGSVLNAQFLNNNSNILERVNNEWISFINRNKICAFSQISIAPNKQQQLLGYQNLLSLGGLAPLSTNTVVMPLCKLCKINCTRECSVITAELYQSRKLSAYDMISDNMDQIVFDSPKYLQYEQYIQLLQNILSMNKNIILTHNFEYFNYNLIASKPIQNHFNVTPTESPPLLSNKSILNKQFIKRKKLMLPDGTDNKWIDIWLFADQYTFDINDLTQIGNNDAVFPMLIMQFAHILSTNKIWKTNANLRVLLLVQKQQCFGQNDIWMNMNKQKNFMKILKKLRLKDYITKIETIVLPINETYNFELNAWFDSSGSKISDYLYNDNDNDNDNIIYNDTFIMEQRIEKYFHEINKIIRYHSDETYFTFLSLPQFNKKQENNNMISSYIQSLHILTKDLPPTALVKCGQNIPVISVDI